MCKSLFGSAENHVPYRGREKRPVPYRAKPVIINAKVKNEILHNHGLSIGIKEILAKKELTYRIFDITADKYDKAYTLRKYIYGRDKYNQRNGRTKR